MSAESDYASLRKRVKHYGQMISRLQQTVRVLRHKLQDSNEWTDHCVRYCQETYSATYNALIAAFDSEREKHAKTKIELEAAQAKIEELECELSICRGEYDDDRDDCDDTTGYVSSDADEAVPVSRHSRSIRTEPNLQGARAEKEESVLYSSPPVSERGGNVESLHREVHGQAYGESNWKGESRRPSLILECPDCKTSVPVVVTQF